MQIRQSATTSEQFICDTKILFGTKKNLGVYAMAQAANDLAAQGAISFSMDAQILLPPYAHKSRINTMRKYMQQAARSLPIEELLVQGSMSPAAAKPSVILTSAALVPAEAKAAAPRAGQDIVMTSFIGLEGMLRIIDEKEAELKERFTPAFIKQIRSYETQIFALREIDAAKAMGDSIIIRQITDGGILAALWNLALEAEAGISADLKKISIKQETIEVCEHYRLNPYQLTSAGCMLMVTSSGEALAEALNRDGVMASVIGKLTDSNDKIIRNGEDVRYIDRPAPDELMKI